MRKGKSISENKTILDLQKLFTKYPSGLCVTEAINLIREEDILRKPTTIIKYLRKMANIGVLRTERLNAGRGPPRKIYKLAIPVPSQSEELDRREILKIKEKLFRTIYVDSEVGKLREKPSDYWILYLLDLAGRAGLMEDLITSQNKAKFVEKMFDATLGYYVPFGKALTISTDISWLIVKSILGAILILIYQGREDIEDIVKRRCEVAAPEWATMVAKAILNAVKEGRLSASQRVASPSTFYAS